MFRFYNNVIGVAFFEILMVVDIGDIFINIYNLVVIVDIIYNYIVIVVGYGCKFLILGGDYIIIYLIF